MRGMHRMPMKAVSAIVLSMSFVSCGRAGAALRLKSAEERGYESNMEALFAMAEDVTTGADGSPQDRAIGFSVMNTIVRDMAAEGDYAALEWFLTSRAARDGDGEFNSYWLMCAGLSYLDRGASDIARYYFERTVNSTRDLIYEGRSTHLVCLEHLINMSESPENRIRYLRRLLDSYADEVNATELIYSLAVEYGEAGDWTRAMSCYEEFLSREDADTVRIPGHPNAYMDALELVSFAESSKDWMFATLDELVSAVRSAIARYDYNALDSYKAKVNFFAMSWRQDMTDSNARDPFSMRSFMRGQRIRCDAELDASSTPNEAYLRTTGWSNYVNVWYLYFRKVNFPPDPSIHGRWEWAGIYFGEKL